MGGRLRIQFVHPPRLNRALGSRPCHRTGVRGRARSGPGARIQRETGMTEETVYLTPLQAARILGLSAKTLARYRVKAKGPVFVKLEGRVTSSAISRSTPT